MAAPSAPWQAGLALLAGLLAAAPAVAGSLSWTFHYAGAEVEASGTLTTTDSLVGGAYAVTGITGTHNEDPITGLLPPNSFNGNDNRLFPESPFLSAGGIGFKVGQSAYALYLSGSVSEACGAIFERGSICQEDPFLRLSLSVVPATTGVPEPATGLLLGAGLLGLAATRRRGGRDGA